MPDEDNEGKRQLAILHRASRILSSGLPVEAVLQQLMLLALELAGSAGCVIIMRDAETGEMVLRAAEPATSAVGACAPMTARGFSSEWLATHSSAIALSSNAAADPRFRWLAAQLTFEAILSAPLVARGELVGVVLVYFRQPRSHTPEEVALLCFLGEQIGCAIACARVAAENDRLAKDVMLARQQLEERKTVERAKGLLQQRFGLSEDQAYQRLREESRRRRRPMREVAEAVLLVEGITQIRPRSEARGK